MLEGARKPGKYYHRSCVIFLERLHQCPRKPRTNPVMGVSSVGLENVDDSNCLFCGIYERPHLLVHQDSFFSGSHHTIASD